MKPVCLVLGAGAGIGGTVAAKFASKGYHSYLCRRSDKEGLDRLIANIEKNGGTASGCLLNAADDDVLENLITSIDTTNVVVLAKNESPTNPSKLNLNLSPIYAFYQLYKISLHQPPIHHSD